MYPFPWAPSFTCSSSTDNIRVASYSVEGSTQRSISGSALIYKCIYFPPTQSHLFSSFLEDEMTFRCSGLTTPSFLLILFPLSFFRILVPFIFYCSFFSILFLPDHEYRISPANELPPHTLSCIKFYSLLLLGDTTSLSLCGWTSPKSNLPYPSCAFNSVICPAVSYEILQSKNSLCFFWDLIWCLFSSHFLLLHWHLTFLNKDVCFGWVHDLTCCFDHWLQLVPVH